MKINSNPQGINPNTEKTGIVGIIFLLLKGAAMGVAEVIPGVSGGTIAFITGIYERLLNSIKAFGPSVFSVLKNDGIKGAWQHINGGFLVNLFAGMFLGLLSGLFIVAYFLENFPIHLWAFFFGLIVASAIYVGRQIEKWRIIEVVLMLVAAAIAYYVTIATPAQGSEALWYVFLCGMIAISALLLPGLSGSFMLLLLGMYQFILHDTLKTGILQNHEMSAIITMGVFALGCVVGVTTFARILSWTFKNYRFPTFAALTGFMIGSLNKVWPWQQVLSTRTNSKGEEVIEFSKSVLPNVFSQLNEAQNIVYGNEPYVLGAVLMMVVGFVSVFVLERLGNTQN